VVAGSAAGSEENSLSCEMDCNTTLNVSEIRGSEEYGKQPPKKKNIVFRLHHCTHWIILIYLKVLQYSSYGKIGYNGEKGRFN
jgi:hypothetical protein